MENKNNEDPNLKPTIEPQGVELIPKIQQFANLGIIPTGYRDSMTYYEIVAWLCKFCEEQVIPALNNNANGLGEIQNLFEQLVAEYNKLYKYVDDYFTNLDLQEEVNTKIDEMAENGTLKSILESYINFQNISRVFNTFDNMIMSTDLKLGEKYKILGYNSINDGGGNEYYATSIENENRYQIPYQNFYIELITPAIFNPIMFGAFGNNLNDDTDAFIKAIMYGSRSNRNAILDLLNKTYNLLNLQNLQFKYDMTIQNGTINCDEANWRSLTAKITFKNLNVNIYSQRDLSSREMFFIFAETGDSPSYYIENCIFTCQPTAGFNNKTTVMYLKDYKSIIIKNSKFINLHREVSVGGCLWLNNHQTQTEKILIENSEFTNYALDEAIGIYNEIDCDDCQVLNNRISTENNSLFAFTIYKKVPKNVLIDNNIIHGTRCLLYLNYTDVSAIERNHITNNNFYYDKSRFVTNVQNIVTGSQNCEKVYFSNNNFYIINSDSMDTKTLGIINLTSMINRYSNVLFDKIGDKNIIGYVKEHIGCYIKNIRSITGTFINCIVESELMRIGTRLTAQNCYFNFEQTEKGYITEEILVNNTKMVGTLFSDGKLQKLEIENSDFPYSQGPTPNNLVNTLPELKIAATAGHIINSSMNGVPVENISI